MTKMIKKSISESGVDVENWLHAYQQMVKIREFEEKANELYLSALMPGLTHLYIGEEAVAVGVCEVLRRDDYITSTHRGHGHCLAKGAAVDLMFAELLMIVVGGLKFGAIYALAAIGIVVIHKATRTVNFAHGAFVLLGAYTTYGVVEVAHLGYWPSFLLAPLAAGLLAA